MNRKYFLFILQFLTSICIVSVGFASWTIVTPPIIEEGLISSEPVLATDTYLDIEIEDIKFCEEGFVTDGFLSFVGYLTLNCKVQNLDNFNKIFCTYDAEGNKHLDYDSLKIELALSYDEYNLFETTAHQSSTHIIEGNGINITDTFPTGKRYNKYVLEITLNDILTIVEDSYDQSTGTYSKTEYEFTIKYQFNSSEAIFSNVHAALLTDSSFEIDVKLEGCNRA